MPPKRKNTQDDPPITRARSSSSSSASAPASPAKKSAPASPVKKAAKGKKRPASPTGDSEPPQKVAKKEKAKRDFKGRQCNGRKANGEQCGRRESVRTKNPPPVYYCAAHKPKTTGDGQNQQAQDPSQAQEAPAPTTATAGVEQTQASPKKRAPKRKRAAEDPAPVATTATDGDAEARPPPSPQKREPKRKRTVQDPVADDDAPPPTSPQKRVPRIQPATQDPAPAPTAETESEQSDDDASPPAQQRRTGEKHPPGRKRPAHDPAPAPTTTTDDAEQSDDEAARPAQAQAPAQKRLPRKRPAAQRPIFERTEPSTDELPEDFDACQYLRDALESGIEYELDAPLPPAKLDDVYRTIASVTGAITRIQSRRQGFSFFRGDRLDLESRDNIVLPDRPLFFPYNHGGKGHVVLVVIQYDESDITIHINDPMAWKWSPEERQDICDSLLSFAEKSVWQRAPPEDSVTIFTHINWSMYIDQVDKNATGYCTIINGWIWALGLESARHTLPFSERDYLDLLQVCRLAQEGSADWRLIYAYLVCHGFIEKHSEVPHMRRFRRTEPIASQEDLNTFLDTLQQDDEAYWDRLSEADRQLHFEVGLLPKVRIDRGYPDDAPWPSDSWDARLKEDQARLDRLFEAGVFNSLLPEHDMYNAFEAKWKREGKIMNEQETSQTEESDSDAGADGLGPATTTVEQEAHAEERADQPQRPTTATKAPRETTAGNVPRKAAAGKTPRKEPRKQPVPPQEESAMTPEPQVYTTPLKDPPSSTRRSSSGSKKSTPRSGGAESGPDGAALSLVKAKDHSSSGLDSTVFWSVNLEFEDPQGGQMSEGAQPGLNGSQAEADDTHTMLIEDSPSWSQDSLFEAGSDFGIYGEEEEEEENQEVEKIVEEEENQGVEEQEMAEEEQPVYSGNPLENFRNQFLQGRNRLREVGAHVWGFLEDPRNGLSVSEAADDWCGRFRERHNVLDGICAAADDDRKEESSKIKWGVDAYDDQVGWPIAAVVAAIDRTQKGLNEADAFNGGFALAESHHIVAARDSVVWQLSEEEYRTFQIGSVAHGRRCWLMPLVIQNAHDEEESEDPIPKEEGKKNVMGRGHVLLAVVQERLPEKGATSSEFEVLFLDSARDFYSHDRAYREVQEMAQRLGWTRFLNDEEQVPFAEEHRTIKVPHQELHWSCSLHTVVNAWILALGLQPSANAKYDKALYREIINMAELACGGLMDWKTLASWLFCRGLVVNTSLGDVPTNRRFERSLYLTSDILADVRQDMEVEDTVCASQFEGFRGLSSTPFINRSNNVAWENWKDLTRGYDDFDDSGYEEDAMDIDVDGYGKEDSSAESDRLAWLDAKEGAAAKRDSLDWLEDYDY